ncbi:MAG: type I phosphomannose isomerase catalytic subunit [bacterium]|nr:type I phosphomannose isomerase catalytic subunit [bacterium]
MSLYPLLLNPALHTRVWGGRGLASRLHKPLPTDEPYGESWELHDTVTVVNGAHTGRTIGELVQEYGTALIGEGNNPAEGFPLLVKFLDAQDWLSVQVHPNDAQAAELEGDPRGKTEAWIVLDSAPNAKLVSGVTPGTTRETLAQAIRDNALESLLVYTNVRKGDVLYMPANTVHALGPGLLIYEIQQSSDVTYRLYDWGRLGLDGKPRPLHIEKGVQVSNVENVPPLTHPGSDEAPVVFLVKGDYFVTLRYRLDESARPAPQISTRGQFHALTCTAGDVGVEWDGHTLQFSTGQTVLIPANAGAYMLHGTGEVLRSSQRE